MDNGASSYRRFLEGDDDGIVQIIKDHKDGLMFYLNSLLLFPPDYSLPKRDAQRSHSHPCSRAANRLLVQ